MKKLLIGMLLSLATGVSLFGANYTIMPYGSYMKYSSNVTKDKAYLGGLYTSISYSPFLFEIDAEHLIIKYKNNIVPDWIQNDLTLVGNYYYGYNWIGRLGIHNMFVNQVEKHYEKTLIAGVNYYQKLNYNIGTDFYYSTYPNSMKVYQISPKAGTYFGDYDSYGLFYLQAKENYIHLDNKNDNNLKNNYLNTDLSLKYFKGPLTLTLIGSFGRNAYKIDNNGFVVYNTGDEYKRQVTVSATYNLNKNSNLGIEYSKATFDESNIDNAHSYLYMINYTYYF